MKLETRRRGFTLIELLIVLALFGLATSLITASYVSFERNQRVKTAALTLKNDIRLAQNYASTGYKGTGTDANVCGIYTLEGWYVKLTANPGSNASYRIAGVCNQGSLVNPPTFAPKVVNLPQGVTFSSIDINYDFASGLGSRPAGTQDVYILFETVTNRVYICALTGDPDFTNRATTCETQRTTAIIATGSSGNNYKIAIEAGSGSVYEKK